MKELQLNENAEKIHLSSSSASETTILGVLQALSFLVASLQEKKFSQLYPEKDFGRALSQACDINAALESLWPELRNCKVEGSSQSPSEMAVTSANLVSAKSVAPPLPVGTQNILPYSTQNILACDELHPGHLVAVKDIGTATQRILMVEKL